MTSLIGLSGGREVGKDTAFGYIQEWAAERGLSAHRRGFADALKQSFARMFLPDISLEEATIWCNALKFTGSMAIEWSNKSWRREEGVDTGTVTTIEHRISGRTALQRYGTEGHRDVFGDDFWVDVLLPTRSIINEHDLPEGPAWPYNFRGPVSMEPPDIAVVNDCRFENEAKRIKMLGGFNVVIYRDTGIEDQHVSEAGIPPKLVDWTIRNNGSLDEFRAEVRQLCDVLLAETHQVEPEKDWPQPKLPQ